MRAYTSYAQLPLEHVAITVTSTDGTAIAMLLTDRSGRIEPIPVPVPDKMESQAPDPGERPYTAVDLFAHLRGFERVEAEDLQVFAGTTTVQELELIRHIGLRHGVTLELLERDYCEPTDFEGEAYKALEALLHENFPDVAVVPFLLTAGTDARRFTGLADSILRFAPIDLSREQFATIHSANERIGLESIGQCVVFYRDLIGRI